MSSESRDIPQSYLSAKPGDSSTPPGMTTGTRPRRRLGLFDATMIVMGGIVGAGIFANPSEVAHRVHTPFLILSVWVLGGMAAVAVIFASYFRALTGANCSDSAIAAIALLALTAINCFGARTGSNVQSALMLLKIGAIAMLVIIGFAIGHPATAGLKSEGLFGESASFGLLKSIGAAMVPVAFAYGGWQTATFVAGEMRDARRDLSRGLLIG